MRCQGLNGVMSAVLGDAELLAAMVPRPPVRPGAGRPPGSTPVDGAPIGPHVGGTGVIGHPSNEGPARKVSRAIDTHPKQDPARRIGKGCAIDHPPWTDIDHPGRRHWIRGVGRIGIGVSCISGREAEPKAQETCAYCPAGTATPMSAVPSTSPAAVPR